MNKLLLEGYAPVVGDRALTKMRRDHGHTMAARKHRFDAPGDYTPGKDDDLSNGYWPGSRMMNQHKEVFLCVDASEGKANWIRIGSLADNATENSFVNERTETAIPDNGTQPDATSDTVVKKDVEEKQPGELPPTENAPIEESSGDVATQTKPKDDGSPKGFTMGASAGPKKGKTAIPEDMPWGKFLEKNDLESIEEVQRKADNNELVDLKYLNEDRAADIADWLDEN